MGQHDRYGKRLMRAMCGGMFTDYGPRIEVQLGAGAPRRIDGAVGDQIAVEIDSRVSKQIRGALIDLVLHSYAKKLLILVPVHMTDPVVTRDQCRYVLARLLEPGAFEIVVLSGTGDRPEESIDSGLIRVGLGRLG